MRVRGRLGGAIVGTALVALVGTLLRRSIARFEIAEESMAPTLRPGDYVLARSPGAPRRGMVVLFPHPGSSMHGPLVKRVVGLGGETIEVGNGQVNVEGRPLAEPWADGPTLGSGRWNLERDQVFVLGDNRSAPSVDSRALGPIASEALEWRVVFLYWPPARWGRVAGKALAE